MKLSIVIPVYNEEVLIQELYKRLSNVLHNVLGISDYEILFINDGSTDKTYEYLLKLHHQVNRRIHIISLSRNFGHHIALTAGLDYASGDMVLTMDGDLQDQPEEIPKLLNKFKEGYDMVYGIRKNKKFSWGKRLSSKIFFFFLRYLLTENVDINSAVFRVMSKQVVDYVRQCREANRYVLGLIAWIGFKSGTVAVEHGARHAGQTKYGFWRRYTLALDAIFSFSDYPLKIITRFGMVLVMVSSFLLLMIIIRWYFWGESVLGWVSLISTILFIGGMQILMLGIIGEYIGRVHMEVKRRPLYIVKKIIGRVPVTGISNRDEMVHNDAGMYENEYNLYQ